MNYLDNLVKDQLVIICGSVLDSLFYTIALSCLFTWMLCSDGKESAYKAGDLGSIPRSGRYSGEGNGNPLQYSCLENSMDIVAWQATVHGVTEPDTTKLLTLSLHYLNNYNFITSFQVSVYLLILTFSKFFWLLQLLCISI